MGLAFVEQNLYQYIARLAFLGAVEYELHVAGRWDEIVCAERLVKLVKVVNLNGRTINVEHTEQW